MPYTDVTYPILAFSQRFDDRIDAVTDDSKYMGCAPVDQRLNHYIRSIRVGAALRRRLRRNISFRLRRLRGRGHARSGGEEASRGCDLEEITPVPLGKLATAHRDTPR